MTTKTTVIALALVVGLAAGGGAVAQSMQPQGGMAGGMQGMHEKMQAMHDMHGGMQGGMHGGMQRGTQGGMHGGMQGGMQGGMHGGHGQGGPGHSQGKAAGDQSASSLAFAAVNEKMHRDMAIDFSGNADGDFVRGMIPHHQGAIDMAKIVIAFGKDPEVKKLAEEIVKAQESEIALMQAWLQKRGK